MKEIRNYKNLRSQPYIYGFSPTGFYVFVGIGLLTLFSFTTGFSIIKIIIVAGINLISFIYTKYFMNDNALTKYLLNDKFPKEISDLTKKKSK